MTDATLKILSLNAGDVLRFGPLLAGHEFEVDFFSLHQSFVSLPLNRGMVNKNVLSRFPGDEAETQSVVEPFHFSTGHNLILPCLSAAMQSKQAPLAPTACSLTVALHPQYDSHTELGARLGFSAVKSTVSLVEMIGEYLP